MAKFDFTTFDAAVNELNAKKQTQIDSQQAQRDAQAPVLDQTDANVPIRPETAPRPAEGFDINAFLGRQQEPQPEAQPTQVEQPEPSGEVDLFAVPEDQKVDLGPLQEGGKRLLADEKAMELLSDIRDEIPSGPAEELPEQEFGLGQPAVSGRIRSRNIAREATKKIKALGFSDEDIASAISFRQAALPPSKKFQQAAGTIAGVGIPAAVNLIPGLAAAPEEIITVPLVAKALTKLGLRAAGVGAAGAGGAIADLAADPDRELTMDNAFEVAKAGAIEEGALEAAFGGVELGFGRAFGRGGRMAAENVDEINELLARSAKRRGISQPIQLLPGQASQLPSAQAAEAIAESSIFGANPVAKAKALLRKNATALVNDLPAELASDAKILSADHVRNVTRSVIKGEESFHKEAVDKIFDLVREVSGDAKVGTDGIIDAAQSVRDKFAAQADVGYKGEVKELVEQLLDMPNSLPEGLTFTGAQGQRSTLLSISRDLDRSANPNSLLVKTVGELTPAIDKAMADTAESIGGDTLRLWRRGNRLHKANKLLFDDKVITNIMGDAALTNPEVVFDVFKSADERQIKRFIKAFGDNPKKLDQIKSSFLAGMIDDTAVKNVDAFKASGKGEPLGDVILRKFNELGPVEKKLYTPAESKTIRERLRLVALSQRKGEAGLIGLKAAQSLGIVGLAAAPFSGKAREEVGVAGGVLVLGPSVLASLILRRPRFTKLLAQGFKVPPASKEGIKVTGRLARMVLDERKRITKQRENIEKTKAIESFEKQAIQLGARDE